MQVLSLSSNVLETVFKHVLQQKMFLCGSSHRSSSHAVHLVLATGETSFSVVLSLPHSLYVLRVVL